ncbi:MAG: alpha/beta hydrolase [Actinomycetes bacterium]
MTRQTLGAIIATGALIAATGCGRTSDTATTSTTAARKPTTTVTVPTTPERTPNGFPANWTPPALQWRSCDVGERTECATLRVPLDWSKPAGSTVDVAVARQRATGERIGVLTTNPGGPGGSGLEFLSYDSFSTRITEHFDVVSWDPRGVGASTRASCGGGIDDFLALDPDPDTPAERTAIESAAQAVANDCAATSLPLLQHIGTADAARDLEALRLALGNEPLNYVGFSYGTQLGQQYAQFFPSRIRTMVLDGVVDPSLSYTEFLLGQVRAFDASFSRAVQQCRQAGVRRCGVVDMNAAYDSVRARVELLPLPAGKRTVGPAELATAATYVAYLPDGWRDLGPALAEAVRGDGTALWELANSYYDLAGYPTYAGVTCADSNPPRGVADYRKFADAARVVSPRFGGSVANELLPCAFWPVPPASAPAGSFAGVPPVLVVGNTGDPATPYDNAVRVARRLPGGVLLTAQIDGHTAYGSDRCVTRAVDGYLLDRTLPAPGTTCR